MTSAILMKRDKFSNESYFRINNTGWVMKLEEGATNPESLFIQHRKMIIRE